MPQLSSQTSPQLRRLLEYVHQLEERLRQVQVLPVDVSVQQELQQLEQQKNQPLFTLLSEEEHSIVMEKMRSFVQMPVGHLPRQDELYLEQQLTDMLGFEVVSELEGHRLEHTVGVMVALPHLRRHPNDDLAHHDVYREAAISPIRGGFGWFTEMGQLTPTATQREKYYMAAQIDFLPNYHQDYMHLRQWYRFRKMIVINPHEERAVVSAIGDIGPADWLQKQFGGSPEIIREALVWSPASRGRVLVFFLNDPDDNVPLGVINLSYAQKGGTK